MRKLHRCKNTVKSAVSIRKVENPSSNSIEQGLEALLTDIGGLARVIPSQTHKVLIKPNLMMGSRWETGITVHPLLIELHVPGCPPASDAYRELVERGLTRGDFTPSTVDKECKVVDVLDHRTKM